jgi:hypothetical protein
MVPRYGTALAVPTRRSTTPIVARARSLPKAQRSEQEHPRLRRRVESSREHDQGRLPAAFTLNGLEYHRRGCVMGCERAIMEPARASLFLERIRSVRGGKEEKR